MRPAYACQRTFRTFSTTSSRRPKPREFVRKTAAGRSPMARTRPHVELMKIANRMIKRKQTTRRNGALLAGLPSSSALIAETRKNAPNTADFEFKLNGEHLARNKDASIRRTKRTLRVKCAKVRIQFIPPQEADMLVTHVIRDKGAAVHTLSESATLEQAAKELNIRKVGALVITDDSGRIAGLLSERDIVREIARRGSSCLSDKAASAMTRTVISATPRETIDECLGRMTDRRIRHLPVMEDGRLVGIVSIGDLVKHRIAAVEAEAASLQAYIAAS